MGGGWLIPMLNLLGMGGGSGAPAPDPATPGEVFRRTDTAVVLRRADADAATVLRRTDTSTVFRRPT